MCLRDTKRHEQECVRQNPKLFCCFSILSKISFFNFLIRQCFGLAIGKMYFFRNTSQNALFCEGQSMLTFMMFTSCNNNNYISLGPMQCNVAKRRFSRCNQLLSFITNISISPKERWVAPLTPHCFDCTAQLRRSKKSVKS